jgi:hypothetical protein
MMPGLGLVLDEYLSAGDQRELVNAEVDRLLDVENLGGDFQTGAQTFRAYPARRKTMMVAANCTSAR